MDEIDLPRRCERILLVLDDQGVLKTPEIQNHAGINKLQYTHYDLKERLRDHGLVEDAGRVSGSGPDGIRRWRLTLKGRNWVDEHREEIAIPANAEEACEVATQAHQAAKEAQSSAGTANSEVAEVREEVEEMMDEARLALSRANDAKKLAREEAQRAVDAQAKKRAEEEVADLRSDYSEWTADIGEKLDEYDSELEEIAADVEELEDDRVAEIEERLNRQREVIKDFHSRLTTVEDNVDEIETQLRQLEDRGLLDFLG